jgi:NAD(P)-dependent dehydrogenase (short-subunit alcohol dehydrogenase family)
VGRQPCTAFGDKHLNELSGHAAIVTGAAGGMGAAIARAFADQGRFLILSDLRHEPLEALAKDLRARAPVATVAADITAADYPERILAAIGPRKIDVLVHAAGVSPSMTDGRRILEINFSATRRLVESLTPAMAPGGVIVLIASNSGQLIARPLFDRAVRRVLNGGKSLLVDLMLRNPRAAYPISKRAVQLYVQQASPALGKVGARIVSLSPGIIDTDMGQLEMKAGPEMERMIAVTPLQRMGKPDEIASVVAFLASPAAGYISGTDILVDGGTIAGVGEAGGMMKL